MRKYSIPVPSRLYAETLSPPASHSATLAELPGGTLYCVWYSGSYEGSADTVLYASSRSAAGEWSTPRVIIDLPGLPVGNPVLWYNERDALLHLYFVILYGNWWTESRLAVVTSADGGTTWSSPKLLLEEKGLMPRTPLLTLSDGTLLFPIYSETMWAPLVLRSVDNGRTWGIIGDTTARGVAIQPSLAPLPDGRVLMLSRTNRGRIYRSTSTNGGRSWTASQPLAEPNPNSSIDVIAIHFEGRDGHMMIHNPTTMGRGLLTLSVSWDGGQTWSGRTTVYKGDGEYSYPTMIPASDGGAHLVFTEDRVFIRYLYIDVPSWLNTLRGG
ncbi:MAG: exo-alpha-sialidase [Alicyclobacillus sp.]|nr:exo-alpha-sialidase [Alicyclobacillus sp.]